MHRIGIQHRFRRWIGCREPEGAIYKTSIAQELTVAGSHLPGQRSMGLPIWVEEAVPLDRLTVLIALRQAPEEPLTPLGQLPFFMDLLRPATLFDALVEESPQQYTPPNATQVRDVLATLLLSFVYGPGRCGRCNAALSGGAPFRRDFPDCFDPAPRADLPTSRSTHCCRKGIILC